MNVESVAVYTGRFFYIFNPDMINFIENKDPVKNFLLCAFIPFCFLFY